MKNFHSAFLLSAVYCIFSTCIFLSIGSFAQGTWTQKTNFGGQGRHYAVGFSIGTKGYIGTGCDFNTGIYHKDLWEWDQVTGTWTKKADFPGTARAIAVGFSIGTKGYIGTGYDGTTNYNDFWQWDQPTNAWTQKANIGGTGKRVAVGFSIGAKGYIGTGAGSGGKVQDFWEWDGDSSSFTYNTWKKEANFGGGARYGAKGFSIGTKGYIGTGYDGANHRDFWEYSPVAMGVDELSNPLSISVFPNPLTDGYIQYTVGSEDGYAVIVKVIDMLGREVLTHTEMIEAGVTTNKLPSATLSSGLYLLRITTRTQEKTQKRFMVK